MTAALPRRSHTETGRGAAAAGTAPHWPASRAKDVSARQWDGGAGLRVRGGVPPLGGGSLVPLPPPAPPRRAPSRLQPRAPLRRRGTRLGRWAHTARRVPGARARRGEPVQPAGPCAEPRHPSQHRREGWGGRGGIGVSRRGHQVLPPRLPPGAELTGLRAHQPPPAHPRTRVCASASAHTQERRLPAPPPPCAPSSARCVSPCPRGTQCAPTLPPTSRTTISLPPPPNTRGVTVPSSTPLPLALGARLFPPPTAPIYVRRRTATWGSRTGQGGTVTRFYLNNLSGRFALTVNKSSVRASSGNDPRRGITARRGHWGTSRGGGSAVPASLHRAACSPLPPAVRGLSARPSRGAGARLFTGGPTR